MLSKKRRAVTCGATRASSDFQRRASELSSKASGDGGDEQDHMLRSGTEHCMFGSFKADLKFLALQT